MKKSTKVFIIVISIIAALLAIAIGVLYYLYPAQVKDYANIAWEWLNKPLPVVGTSVLMIIILLWKIFASSSLGKKQLKQFKERTQIVETDFETLKQTSQETIDAYKVELEQMQHKLEEYRLLIKKICETIPNKKVKAIGVNLDGKEEINNETEAE
jgi:energy-coupling factor transporter transmembrane protein EcfT